MRYADVKVGETFFFEDNWSYPKRKTPRGHLDLRDEVTGSMPDDIPVITAADYAQLVAERDALKAAIEEIKLSVVGDKFPNWTSFTRVTEQRMRIADICDNALSAKGER